MDTTRPVAIVTGAGRGIGAATARRLSGDGFAVAILDRDVSTAEEVAAGVIESDGTALAMAVDVTDEQAVRCAVDEVASQVGQPTVLVNNAGILRDNLLFKMTADEWDSVMAVHLRGAFLMARAVQRHMVDAGHGRIINMSSLSALGNRGQSNYAAAKAGLQGLTKTLAIELGRFGVTVNAIAPGFIETDMTRSTAERIGVPFEEFRDSIVADIPVARAGTADDVAAAVSFFASRDAGFVSGQVLYVAGGPTD